MENRTNALGIGKKDHHYVDAKVYDETGQEGSCPVCHVAKKNPPGMPAGVSKKCFSTRSGTKGTA
jgi:hypothetical protein